MKNKGITLVELLVVLAVIAILALIAHYALSTSRIEAKKATLKASMENLLNAAEIYTLQHDYSYDGFCEENNECSGACNDMVVKATDLLASEENPCSGTCSDSPVSWQLSLTCPNFSYCCNNNGCGETCPSK